MIDIIILTEEINTEYTLSSLLNSSENFRLHLFNRRGLLNENMQPTIQWALANFREVYVYQTPWTFKGPGSQRMARVLLQFKEHWKDKAPKGFPIERVLVTTKGARVFNGKFAGNVPTVAQMGDKMAFFSKKYQYHDHKFYGNYYQILGLDAKKYDTEKDFMLLNWAKFKTLNNSNFLPGGKATPQKDAQTGKSLNQVDSFINSADNPTFFKELKKEKIGYMPMYFDMNVDELIKKESIGPKDTINHNIMMRKAFSLNLDTPWLYETYYQMPTLHYMAIPWDVWSNLIDDIPLNLRREAINERLLEKTNHQKRYLRKVVEAGYLLGKI